MDVVRDLLDKPVLDRDGRAMGRVDGIALEQRAGQPPRVSALLVGPSALGHRLSPRLGRWIEASERALGIAEGTVRTHLCRAYDRLGVSSRVELARALSGGPQHQS